MTNEPSTFIAFILTREIFTFIIFLFVSYEFFSQAERHNSIEYIAVTKNGELRVKFGQFGILLLYNSIFSLIVYGICILFSAVQGLYAAPYILFLLKAVGIYCFAINIIAILIGWLLSNIKSEIVGYLSLVIIAFFMSGMSRQTFSFHYKLFSFGELFQIFCVSANYSPNYGYLYATDMHFAVKPCIFIALLFICIFIILWVKKRKKYLLYLCAPMTLLIGCCIFLWLQPASGCFYGYMDQEEIIYTVGEEEIKDAEFYVTEYNIDMDIKNGMNAIVHMSLSEDSLSDYIFTFAAGYKIESIQDGEGVSLSYERMDNFLTIHRGNSPLKKIVITYNGYGSNMFYSGKNGIYLQGNFPYYPIAGEHQLQSIGLCDLPLEESLFTVNIDYDGKIYSNLDSEGNNHFSGLSNNVTLVSGFWKEETIGEIRYIYPYFSYCYNPLYNTYLTDTILEYYNETSDSFYNLKDKTIIISPFAYLGGIYMFGTDSVIIGAAGDLKKFYVNYQETGSWYIDFNDLYSY